MHTHHPGRRGHVQPRGGARQVDLHPVRAGPPAGRRAGPGPAVPHHPGPDHGVEPTEPAAARSRARRAFPYADFAAVHGAHRQPFAYIPTDPHTGGGGLGCVPAATRARYAIRPASPALRSGTPSSRNTRYTVFADTPAAAAVVFPPDPAAYIATLRARSSAVSPRGGAGRPAASRWARTVDSSTPSSAAIRFVSAPRSAR